MLRHVKQIEPAEGRDAQAATLHRRVFTPDQGNRQYMGFIHLQSAPSPAGHTTEPYRKSAEETIYTLAGSMRMVMDDVTYDLTPGTALAISRGQVISDAQVGPDGWEALTAFCSQCPLYLADHPRFPAGTTIPADFPDEPAPSTSYERFLCVSDVTPVEGAESTSQTLHRDVFSPAQGNREFQSFMHLTSGPSPAADGSKPPFRKSGEEVIYTLEGSSISIQNGTPQHLDPGTAIAIARDDLMQSGGTAAGGSKKLSWYCMRCPLYLPDHPRYANP